MSWRAKDPDSLAHCPRCQSVYLLFVGPVVECRYGYMGVKTQQIGARYFCDECGTSFRVTREGVYVKPELPQSEETRHKPMAQPPAIPIRTRRS